MQGLVLKIRAWWNIADKTAKAVTVVGVLFLLVTLVVVFNYASQPDYVVIYADLSAGDAGKVLNKLKDLKVTFRIGSDGRTIEVPKGQRDEIRMKLAADGLPAQAGGEGNGWLDKSSIGRTQAEEQILQRVMLEEEMQKTIQTLDGVDSARIHISMGESGAFADQQRKAAATVVLHLKQGGTLAPDQVNGVVHIVTQGVPDLDKNNVSVVDGSGRVLYDGTTQNGGTGLYDEKRKEEMAYSSNLRGQLERHFDQVLGPGKALVSVETTMNFDSIESDKNINTPAVDATNKAPTNDTNKVSETTSKTTYANGAGGIKGTAGTPSNLTGGGTGSTGSTTPNGREYSEDKKTAEYAFNREHLRTITTPGKVEALNVAVLLDDSLKQPQVQAITDYVNGLVGISPSTPKPGYAVTVSKLPFDQEQAKQAKAAGDKEKSSQMMDRIFGLAPSIALILAAILVMRALGKQSIKVQSPVLPEGLMPLALGPGVESMPTAGEGAIARVPSAQIDSGPNIVYTDSHEARIVTMIPQKFDLAFEQISVMAKEKPETIAVLLKSWMMEDKH